jgi:hypothetical protein
MHRTNRAVIPWSSLERVRPSSRLTLSPRHSYPHVRRLRPILPFRARRSSQPYRPPAHSPRRRCTGALSRRDRKSWTRCGLLDDQDGFHRCWSRWYEYASCRTRNRRSEEEEKVRFHQLMDETDTDEGMMLQRQVDRKYSTSRFLTRIRRVPTSSRSNRQSPRNGLTYPEHPVAAHPFDSPHLYRPSHLSISAKSTQPPPTTLFFIIPVSLFFFAVLLLPLV